MPLNLVALKDGLEDCFADDPTAPECGQAWADAVGAYAAAVVPASTAVTAAKATLTAALSTVFAAPDAAAAMETAFAAFATTVGAAMAGYTSVPPPTPVGFAAQFAGTKPDTHADAADQIGELIDAWMTTGVSTLIASPFTVVTWN